VHRTASISCARLRASTRCLNRHIAANDPERHFASHTDIAGPIDDCDTTLAQCLDELVVSNLAWFRHVFLRLCATPFRAARSRGGMPLSRWELSDAYQGTAPHVSTLQGELPQKTRSQNFSSLPSRRHCTPKPNGVAASVQGSAIAAGSRTHTVSIDVPRAATQNPVSTRSR
jgi:hypothetical protein